MSRKLFTFLLTELKTIRVICSQCGTVVEQPIDVLARQGKDKVLNCKFCHQDFNPQHQDVGPLLTFAQALQKMQELGKVVGVEFVVPAEE
jgi:hypothetical protein